MGVMEDQAADELNSMEEEGHKQEAQENEEGNQNDDLNGNNASNGHDLDEAEEGVKNAAKKVLDALNNRENDNTGDEEVKRDSIEEVSLLFKASKTFFAAFFT